MKDWIEIITATVQRHNTCIAILFLWNIALSFWLLWLAAFRKK